jgi:hypothetical protein
VVSSVKARPDAKWYREKPDEAIPTVEVPAK